MMQKFAVENLHDYNTQYVHLHVSTTLMNKATEELETASSIWKFHGYHLGKVLTCREEESPRDRCAVVQ